MYLPLSHSVRRGPGTSAFLLLFLTFATLFGTLTTAHAQTVSTSHPRIWLTPARLTRLKDYAARNTTRWQTLKAYADSIVAASRTNNPANSEMVWAEGAGLAYQVTGNPAYAQAAIYYMLYYAVPSDTLTDDSWYQYRYLYGMIAGYDWCYDQMTPAQRKQIAGWLMDRSDAVWPETNPSRLNAWGTTRSSNNYFYGFLFSWSAALAVDPADDPRCLTHRALGLSKYRNVVRPFTDTWGTGGIFAESTNYDSCFDLGLQVDAYTTATGYDLLNEPGFSFLHDSLLWRIYATSPDKNYYYPWGTQSRLPIGNISFQDRDRDLPSYNLIQDNTLSGYAKFWLDSLDQSQAFQYGDHSPHEFLYYDEDQPGTDYTKALPLSYFGPGPGIHIERSDWTPQATWWGIWCGPLLESHQNFDVNGFTIWKGSQLVSNDSMWSHSGTWQDTYAHNNMTFGGYEQSWQEPDANWPNPAGTLLKHEVGSDYTYFAGQAAQAYVQNRAQSGVPVVSDYVRKFVSIPSFPDLFLVYDRATTLDPGAAKQWYLHSHTPITVNGRSYAFDNGQYRCVGQSLLPSSGVSVAATPVYAGADPNTASSYRLEVDTNNNQPTDHMLNVLQIAPAGASNLPQAQALTASSGNMEGMVCRNWVVLIGKADRVDGNVTYDIPATVTTQDLLLDLVPNTSYAVTIVTNGSPTTTTLTSSSAGSLRFSAPAQSHVSLAPASTPTAFKISGQVTLNGTGQAGVSVSAGGQGAVTAADGTYTIGEVAAGTYSVNAGLSGFSYTLPQTVTVGPNASGINFTGSIAVVKTYSITGIVTTNGYSARLAGATISAGGQTTTTGTDGHYVISGLTAGTYTVSGSLSGYTFTAPVSVKVGPDGAANFDGEPGASATYSIRGSVTANGAGLGGVQVSNGSATNTTAADGTYRFTGLAAATYVVSVSSSGYTFSAPQNVTVGPDQTGVNFAGTASAPASYSVSGHVTLNGTGQAAATVTVGGQSAVTAADGTYSVSGLAAGSYTVHAVQVGYTLSADRAITVGPSATGIDFTATVDSNVTFSVSGRVTASGSGLAKVVVTVGGRYAVTAADGAYAVAGLSAGTYAVAVSQTGYSLGGPQSVTVGPSAAGVDFAATTYPTALTVGPAAVTGGAAATGTVTLNAPAPTGGIYVNLGSSDPTTKTGSYVFVPAGQTSTTFPITTVSVSQTVVVSISAAYNGVTQTATLTITSTTIQSYSVSGSVMTGGTGLAGATVTVGGQSAVTAADGAYSVSGLAAGSYTVHAVQVGYTLSADRAITVGPSATGVGFTAAPVTSSTYGIKGKVTAGGSALAKIVVTAGSQYAVTAADGTYAIAGLSAGTYAVAVSQTGYSLGGPQSVTVGPSAAGVDFAATTYPTALTVGPAAVTGGAAATGTVTLNAPAPTGGLYINLGISNSVARVGSYVFVPAGQTSTTFPITTTAVTRATSVTISVAYNGVTRSAMLTVMPAKLAK